MNSHTLKGVAALVLAVLACSTLVASQRQATPEGRKFLLATNDRVPSTITGVDRAGQQAEFSFLAQSKPTVVYVISPFSPFVVDNERRFSSLMRQAGKRYAWLLLSPNEPQFTQYMDKISVGLSEPFVAITAIPPDMKQTMMLGGYPQTLVISNRATVLRNFMGAYVADSMSAQPEAIESFFGITLPKEPR